MATFADFLGASDDLAQARREMELKRLIAISQNPNTFRAAQTGASVGRAIGGAFGNQSAGLQGANVRQAAAIAAREAGFTRLDDPGTVDFIATFLENNGDAVGGMQARTLGQALINRSRKDTAGTAKAVADARKAESEAIVSVATAEERIALKALELAEKQREAEQAPVIEALELEKLQAQTRKANIEAAKAYRSLTDDVPKSDEAKEIANIESDIQNGHLDPETGLAMIARIKDPPDKNFMKDKRAVVSTNDALVRMINLVESVEPGERIDPIVMEELAQDARIAAVMLKDSFGLGALNGPDMDLLNDIVVNPGSVSQVLQDMITRGESSSASLRRALKLVQSLGKQVESDYNRKLGRMRKPAFFDSPFTQDRELREMAGEETSALRGGASLGVKGASTVTSGIRSAATGLIRMFGR